MNSNNNEWRTVGGRRAPTAFSNGSSDTADRRREQERANADAEAARKHREQQAKRAADAKEKAATAFHSEDAYPSLGGSTAGARAQTVKGMNYSKTVAEMAEREREAALLMEQERVAAQEAFDADEFYARGIRRRAQIATRCYDDSPEDYNGPEEFEDAEDEESDYEEFDVDESNEDGEFNAHLAVTHRSGDKGVW
jgi:hypothetical protein